MTKITTLSNGIRVVTEKLSYLRTASFGVWVKVGSAKETKENNGISHMIEHMLFKGTTNRSTKEIADIIALIGDDVNAFTGKEVTCYYGTTITEQLEKLVNLIADMLLHSNFTKEDIIKEKRIICDEIDMYEDSAEDLVHELLQQKVYKEQSLGFIISGTKSNVRSFTRQQLIDFMKLHYTADNILISVAGNFDETTLMQQLEQEFADIKGSSHGAVFAKNRLKETFTTKLSTSPYEQKYNHKNNARYYPCFCTKHKDNEQLHINIAYPSISLKSEEAIVFTIFNSMLGGSNNSRLFQKIREELSLVYSIYSYGSSFEEVGLFHIDITVNQGQAMLVLEETKQVIEEFLLYKITDEELNTHKNQVKTELIMSSESAKSRMDANAKGVLIRGHVKTLDQVLEEIDKVTTQTILDFAQKVLKQQKPSMCVVGAENQVKFSTLKKEFEQQWQTLE